MTKAEREALEALAAKWDSMADDARNAEDQPWQVEATITAFVNDVRRIMDNIATLDKPATRYPWADALPEEMFASTDKDGTVAFHKSRPVPKIDKTVGGYWLSGKMGRNAARYINLSQINVVPCPDWRDSLERRPDAP